METINAREIQDKKKDYLVETEILIILGLHRAVFLELLLL